MNIKFAPYWLLAGLALLAAGCNQQQASTPNQIAAEVAVATATTPDAAVLASAKALRANNVGAFLENSLPPAQLGKLKSDWSSNLNKDPITDEDRKKFVEQMAELTAPDAEAKLYAQLEPKLKQFDQQSAQQMPMMIAMGQGFIQSAIQQNKDLNPSQKQQTLALIDATAKWAQTAKFTDPALVKQAIGVLCKSARDLNLKTLDEARALTYDQGMQKAALILAGLKQFFAVYGLSMDNALDSVKAETESTAGDTAKVKVTYTAFEQPFSTESDLIKQNGRWYSKQAIDQWNKKEAAKAAPAGAVAPDATAPQ